MNMKTKTEKLMEKFGRMPRLTHRFPEQPFDWRTSEVGDWLRNNPDALDFLFQQLKDAGAIVFDAGTHQWRGCGTP